MNLPQGLNYRYTEKMVHFASFLLIFAIMASVANRVVFLHTHQLWNGTKVVHAHPYNKTQDSNPIKTHSHDKSDYLFYQNLSLLFFIVAVLFLEFSISKKIAFNTFLQSEIHFEYDLATVPRAPPFWTYQTFII